MLTVLDTELLEETLAMERARRRKAELVLLQIAESSTENAELLRALASEYLDAL